MAKPKMKYDDLTIAEKNFIMKKLGVNSIIEVDVAILKQLKERLKKIKDVRVHGKIVYKLWDIVICVIIASFAFCNEWDEIEQFVNDNYKWFKSFLQMTGGVPKAQTYERVISLVDSDELNQILFEFFAVITFNVNNELNLLHFDGRSNNGSGRKATMDNDEVISLNCLNVYSSKYKYCLYTKMIEEKSNEIPAIEEVISGLDLTGIIVTWDALNSQLKNVEAVTRVNGDYVIPIKNNQGVFHQDLVDYFDEKCLGQIKAGRLNSAYCYQTEKSHSAIIEYEYFQTSDINWYHRKEEWKGLTTIGMVLKKITKKETVLEEVGKTKEGKIKRKKVTKITTTIEKRYYISSRNVNIDEFSEAIRKHWQVENNLHWHLDFTFKQDDNRTINKKALFNLELINKFVLGVLNRVKPRYNRSLKNIRRHLFNNIKEFFPEMICYLMLDK